LSGYTLEELTTEIKPGNIFVFSEKPTGGFDEKTSWATELKLVHKSGRHIPVSLTMSTIKEKDSTIGMVGVLKDLTQLKKNEEYLETYTRELQRSRAELERANTRLIAQQKELRRSKAELEKMARIKNTFIANLSQELKTPLVAGMGYIDLILNGDAGIIDRDIQKYLEISQKNLKKLSTLIDNLLSISSLTGGGEAEIAFDVVDLEPRIYEWLGEAIRGHAVTLTVEIPRAAALVRGDDYLLSQVFSNLLQFSREHDTRVPFVTISAAVRPKKMVEVTYHDENLEISDDILRHVFDSPFEETENAETYAPASPMNLAIVRHIVEFHGGTIEVKKPASRRGTSFVFRLQRHVPAENPSGGG